MEEGEDGTSGTATQEDRKGKGWGQRLACQGLVFVKQLLNNCFMLFKNLLENETEKEHSAFRCYSLKSYSLSKEHGHNCEGTAGTHARPKHEDSGI